MPLRTLSSTLLALLALAALCGWRVFGGGAGVDSDILWLRLNRCLSGVMVGGSLALAGVFLQCLLRNPLASSDLLGLASGAGFAVLLAVMAGLVGAAGVAAGGLALPVVAGAACVGAFAALLVTFLLSRRRGVLDPVLLVLTGVAVGIVCSAGSMLLRHMLPYQFAVTADRMLHGALRDDVGAIELWIGGAVTLGGAVSCWLLGPQMDIASLGDDEAISLGVRLDRLRGWMFFWSGVLTACSIVLAGPIGFVGLVCPHVARLLNGPNHRSLCVVAALLGACLVVGADVLVRNIEMASGRLPLSVMTAMIGGPVFIWLLRRDAAAARY